MGFVMGVRYGRTLSDKHICCCPRVMHYRCGESKTWRRECINPTLSWRFFVPIRDGFTTYRKVFVLFSAQKNPQNIVPDLFSYYSSFCAYRTLSSLTRPICSTKRPRPASLCSASRAQYGFTETPPRGHAAVCPDSAYEGYCTRFKPYGDDVYAFLPTSFPLTPFLLWNLSLNIPQQCSRRSAS